MTHETTVTRYAGTLTELAADLGDLRYDALATFLQDLSAKIDRDGRADAGRGRKKLAASLHACAAHLADAARETQTAWQISEPFMSPVAERLAKRRPLSNARTGVKYELGPADAANRMETDPTTVVSICNEPPIYDLLFAERCTGKPYAPADAERFLAWAERGWHDGTHFVYLIRSDSGEVAGAVDIKSANLPSAEIGYWLSARHSGVMTNAVCALCEVARGTGYAELFGLVRQTNIRSANVLRRAGFTPGETLTKNGIRYDRWAIVSHDRATPG
ncbi:MAG: GNAT family N-acetyltransferase [Akkermansiaceae bacterium]|nr:GNAT family N-acetyltransferase [Armatimonadota bacterium]